MREYQIRIEPFAFIALQELKMERKVNEHAKAEITMRIRDDRREQYMGILSDETWVKIKGTGEQGGSEATVNTVLFHGLVTGFAFSRNGYETLLRLELTSGTVLMDLEQHFRVFQNKESVCAEIHKQLAGAYPEGQADCLEGSGDRTGGVLIQYRETDWEFLKRIAGRTGNYLMPDAVKKGAKYSVGLPAGTNRTISPDKVNVKFDMGEYLEKSRNGMASLQAADMQELIFTDREIYQIGDSVSYGGKNYFIHRIRTEYDRGECSHTYYLRGLEALKVLPVAHGGVTGCSFDATVTAVQTDKVQVEIAGDEWKAADGKKWFPYSTVYSSADGTGWYCMPEEGDSVRLYVPGKEEDSFILSAVHRETDGARQDPDRKSFKTRYGKEILFTPDAILMTNNQGMMVEMNDNVGITISSDRDITIEAADNLTVSSANASLLLTAEDILQVQQGGTAMTLDDDIYFTGGEFRIQ